MMETMQFFIEKKGITLLELMLVVVIIGILAAVAVPRFPGVIKMARESEARAVLRSIYSAQWRYYLQFDEYDNYPDLANPNPGSNLDITISRSDYYTYDAVGGVGPNPIIGRAWRQRTDIENLEIDSEGNISSF